LGLQKPTGLQHISLSKFLEFQDPYVKAPIHIGLKMPKRFFFSISRPPNFHIPQALKLKGLEIPHRPFLQLLKAPRLSVLDEKTSRIHKPLNTRVTKCHKDRYSAFQSLGGL